jgi:hypothetical protein
MMHAIIQKSSEESGRNKSDKTYKVQAIPAAGLWQSIQETNGGKYKSDAKQQVAQPV